MRNEALYMSEEHIVAWLDGELQADGEVRAALKQDASLQSAAKEYNALSQTFARSKNDSRFVLPAAVDARVVGALKTEINRSRKSVAIGERAPDAEPIAKPSTANRMKKIWVRRTSYAALLLLLVGSVWFGLQTSPQAPVTAYAPKEEAPAPQQVVTTPAENTAVPQTAPAPSNGQAVNTIANTSSHSAQVRHTVAVEEPKQIVTEPAPAPAAQPSTAEAADPAAIMISHRYAKLIKATPTVVVSQSDKMDKM
jgi:hypothetical protein